MGQLNGMTNREVMTRYYGILKKQVTQARQMRDISYTIYCSVQPDDKRVEIWEFQPLPGDPTPKQRERAQKAAQIKEAKRVMRDSLKAMEVFRKKGLIN